MLEFKKIELKDKEWVDPLLKLSDYRGAEYCFTNLFIWDGIFKSKIGRYKDFFLLRSGLEGNYNYLYPAGEGDFKEVIAMLEADAKKNNSPFKLIGVTPETRGELKALFPDRFNFTPVRDSFDYVYDAQRLISLSGKKLQSKRNHLNYFLANYNWSIHQITPQLMNEVLDFNHEWCKIMKCTKFKTLSWESCAVEKCLLNFDSLKIEGIALKVDDKIVAYSVGEILNSDTIIIHIEKAFSDIRGAYPMINREFASIMANGFKYVNREDDIGDLGLRKAKKSYNPLFMIEKYNAAIF